MLSKSTRAGWAMPAVAVGALMLVGCSAKSATFSSAPPSAVTVPSDISGAATLPSDTPTVSPSSSTSGTGVLGQTASFAGGLKVTVSKPAVYRPSDSAAGVHKGQENLVVVVVIQNGTTDKYDPSTFTASAAAGAAGVQCDELYDSANGLDSAPSTHVLPGKRATFKLGFSCPGAKGADLVMEITPGFDFDPVDLTGTLP